MKISQLLWACLFFTGTLRGEKLEILPLSRAMNSPIDYVDYSSSNPSKYVDSSKGKVTRSFDDRENAVRFDLEFSEKEKLPWYWAIFNFPAGHTLKGVKLLRFDIKAFQPDGNKKFRRASIQFGEDKDKLRCEYPEVSEEWQTVEVKVADVLKETNPAKVHSLRIGMNPTSSRATFFLRNVQLLGSLRDTDCIPMTIETDKIVHPAAPATMFTVGEELRFECDPLRFYTDVLPTELRWSIADWKGRTVLSGIWPDKGKSVLTLKPLPTGYYTMTLTAKGISFCGKRSFLVVADPSTRKRNENSYFAVMTAQGDVARADRNNSRFPWFGYEVISEAARRAGVQTVRDYFSFARSASRRPPAEYQWFEFGYNADLLHDHGISVLSGITDCPGWVRGKLGSLPSDLVATYNYCQYVVKKFQGKINYWGFWNEPEFGAYRDGAWDLAAAMKAFYLGMKSGDPAMPVLMPGIALTPIRNYYQVAMDSGLEDYIDIFNVHTYRTLREYPEMMETIREFMKRNKMSDRPVWFTENGTDADGAGRLNSYQWGLKAHDADQELIQAEFLPKAMIYLQSMGVDRDFFFILAPRNERGGNKDWGMLRRDYTAKPIVAAFATLTEMLDTATYLGTLNLGRNIRAFLYQQPDGTQSVICWTLSEIDTKENVPNLKPTKMYTAQAVLPTADGQYSGRDLFGVPFRLQTRAGKLFFTVNRFPCYISGLHGLKPAEPFVPRKTAFAPAKVDYDRTVIIRADFDDRHFQLAGEKDALHMVGDRGNFTFQIFNLSDQPKSGTVQLDGGMFTNVPPGITLPPFGKYEFVSEFTPALAKGKFQVNLRAAGIFNGKRTSPMVIPVVATGQMLAAGRKDEMPTMVDPNNWRPYTSGKMHISYDESEKALKCQVEFPPNTPQRVYPEYELQLPQESLAHAIAIEFEVKHSFSGKVDPAEVQVVVENKKGKRKAIWLSYPPPPINRWEKRVVFFDRKKFDPADIQIVRIGMCPKADKKGTYWFKNVKIIF